MPCCAVQEEAVKTYTGLLEDVEAGRVWSGRPVPKSALAYWHLPPDATMRDLVLAVRADEACHGWVRGGCGVDGGGGESPALDHVQRE